MIILKSPHEIECIRRASKLTADTLSLLVERLNLASRRLS